MSLSVSVYTIIVCAVLVSWIGVDLISNMLLKKSKTGVQFRLKLLGARLLTWKRAVVASVIQFGVTFVASYLIQDYFAKLFSQNIVYLFPILLSACGCTYTYILGLTPYKKTFKRLAPSLILMGIAILFFLSIWYFTFHPFQI